MGVYNRLKLTIQRVLNWKQRDKSVKKNIIQINAPHLAALHKRMQEERKKIENG